MPKRSSFGYFFFLVTNLVLITFFSEVHGQTEEDYTLTIEEYAVDGVAGMTTFRFYIDMVNPDDFLSSVFGNDDDPLELLTTTGFYNDVAANGSSADGINPVFLVPPFDVYFPNLAYDSWFTIGIESEPTGSQSSVSAVESLNQPWVGCFDVTSPLSGQNVVMDDITGGAWYVLNGTPNGIPDAENQRVLCLQLTTAGEFSGIFNVQIFVNGIAENDIRPTFFFDGVGTFSHTPYIPGCTNSNSCNYDSASTVDDGSCLFPESGYNCDGVCLNDYDGDGVCNEFEVLGCVFQNACNFNPLATDDDGSCYFLCPGCTDAEACNYDEDAIQDDGTCEYPIDIYGVNFVDCANNCLQDFDGDGICDENEIMGCTNSLACNFNPLATSENGTCLIPSDEECTDCFGSLLISSDQDGDGICDFEEIPGCNFIEACNFEVAATDDDGSCIFPIDICGQVFFDCNCDCLNDADNDGVCDEEEIVGCQDPIACNYNENATDPGACETTSCAGCIYPYACNYDSEAIYSDGSCEFGTCAGCTNPSSCNYNPTLTEDDGSCADYDECGICAGNGPAPGYDCGGNCIDSNENDICDFDEAGCTDANACNFDALASEDDGSCLYPEECFDCDGVCLDDNLNELCDCEEIPGCLDESACNYDDANNVNDYSCEYPPPYRSCDGICFGDSDLDGICDEEDSCPFDSQNDEDNDGYCLDEEVFGCTDSLACNYSELATEDDNSCVILEEVYGDAYAAGLGDGLEEGFETGYEEGFNNGYQQGFLEGETIGYEEGSDEGYILGFQDGQDAAMNQINSGIFCGNGTRWAPEIGECVPVNCLGDFDGNHTRGTEDLLILLTYYDLPCPTVSEGGCIQDSVFHMGYYYPVVEIGNQCWFAENLQSEFYANGDEIDGELSNQEWSTTEEGAQAHYDNADSLIAMQGRLYNGLAIIDARGLCPIGWHVPTDSEWNTLEIFLGMTISEAIEIGWRGTNQGTQMKASSIDTPSWNGTNIYGFSGLPGGKRRDDGSYALNGTNGYWWSDSFNGSNNLLYRGLNHQLETVLRHYSNERMGYSVRCVRDAPSSHD